MCRSLDAFRRTVILLALTALLPGLRAAGALPKRHYEFAAGDATTTLRQFVEQSGEQVIYLVPKVRGVKTNEVKGSYTAREVLDRLVANTALTVVEDSKTGALMINRSDSDDRPESRPTPPQKSQASSEEISPTMKIRNPITLLIGWLTLALSPSQAANAADGSMTPAGGSMNSSSGAVVGRVFNPVNGSYLNNALIVVEGTGLSTFTNDSGEYRLVNVPRGDARITASFTGLSPTTVTVRVDEGQATRQNFDLVPPGHAAAKSGDVVVMDKFTLHEKLMNTQMVALNEQRYAPNVKNVVSADEFGDTGEGNVGEFMKYVPGVNIEYSSVLAQGISIRGLPSSGTLITLDGGQVASATIGSGDGRSVNLDALRLNNISRIELTKVPTPDLPANAQGGSVNIISKSGFERKTEQFSYRVYTNFNTNSFKDTGFSTRPGTGPGLFRKPFQPAADFSYIKPVNDKLALTLSGGYSRRYLHFPQAFTDWDLVRNILSNSRLSPQESLQTVASGSLGADWRISKNSLLSLSGMYADTHWRSSAPENNIAYGAGATGDGTFVQGATPGVGSATLAPNDSDTIKRTFQLSLRYRYKGDLWKVESSAHFGRQLSDYPDMTRGVFSTASMSITQLVIRGDGIDRSPHQSIPVRITAATRAGVPVNVLDSGEDTINSVSSNVRRFDDVQSSAKLDVSRDFAAAVPITLRGGLAVNRQMRDLSRQFLQWTFRPTGTAAERLAKNYDVIERDYSAISPRFFAESNRVQWASLQKLYALYQQRPDYFVPNELNNYTNTANYGKRFEETISAAFVRGDLRLLNNRLWVVGGVRFEDTRDEGEGPLTDPSAIYVRNANGTLARDSAGRLILQTTDAVAQSKLRVKSRGAHSKSDYHGYYPSLNFSYNLTDDVVVRAAYARTITRPNLSNIIPGATFTEPDAAIKRITLVNTALRPWTSDGYDLSLESYLIKGGTGSVGLFQKDINGFFGGTTTPATPALLEQYGLDDEYLNYEIATQQNLTDPVRIRGVEFSYRQSLGELVPWLNGFSFFGAATFLDIAGPAEANFATFAPKTLSGGISYSRSRFAVRINANHLGLKKGSAVSAVSATAPAETYRWFPARTVLTANFSYRVYKQISFYGTVNNLLNDDLITHRYAPGSPAYVRPFRFQEYGVDFTLGVKGEF